MNHRWGDKEHPSLNRSIKHCRNCGLICVSRHEFNGSRDVHWKEYWRGTERIDVGGKMPACEPVEVQA